MFDESMSSGISELEKYSRATRPGSSASNVSLRVSSLLHTLSEPVKYSRATRRAAAQMVSESV